MSFTGKSRIGNLFSEFKVESHSKKLQLSTKFRFEVIWYLDTVSIQVVARFYEDIWESRLQPAYGCFWPLEMDCWRVQLSWNCSIVVTDFCRVAGREEQIIFFYWLIIVFYCFHFRQVSIFVHDISLFILLNNLHNDKLLQVL